jgi:hypothetical protein
MKALILGLTAVALAGCNTFNATVDGAQGIVNETIKATGAGAADITSAVGTDITDSISYVTEGAANGIRNVTQAEEK